MNSKSSRWLLAIKLIACILTFGLVVNTSCFIQLAAADPGTPDQNVEGSVVSQAEGASRLPVREMPKDPYVPWDGRQGVPTEISQQIDDRVRFERMLTMIREHAERGEPEVAIPAVETLANPTFETARSFLRSVNGLQQKAEERKERSAHDDLSLLGKWRAESGHGEVFLKNINEAISSKDPYRYRMFIEAGAEAAKYWDDALTLVKVEREQELKRRLTMLVGVGGEVALAAQSFLDSKDPAKIADFFGDLYLAAAKRDAEKRENNIKQQWDAIDKVEAASAYAKKSARIAELRQELLRAYQDVLVVVQQSSNTSARVTNTLQRSEQQLQANRTKGIHSPQSFEVFASELQAAAAGGKQASAQGKTSAAWVARITQELRSLDVKDTERFDAVAAAVIQLAQASEEMVTVGHQTLAAVVAADAATDAKERATKDREKSEKWGDWAKEQSKAAQFAADAAEQQSLVANNAADAARIEREAAEKSEREAQNQLTNINAQLEETRRQAAIAKDQRDLAQAKEREAANFRAQADQANADARRLRRQADAANAKAQQAAALAAGFESQARNADIASWAAANASDEARIRAANAAKQLQVEEARAAYFAAVRSKHQADAGAQEATEAAEAAQAQAGQARTAWVAAKSAADEASGRAVAARTAATHAQAAASQAKEAAERASVAAAKANAAASSAEAGAAKITQQRMQSENDLAQAKLQQAVATDSAVKAAGLAHEAGVAARQANFAAQCSRDAATSASKNAVSASLQAQDARRAAQGVKAAADFAKAPSTTAQAIVVPFTDGDLIATLLDRVAAQEKQDAESLVVQADQTASQAEKDAQTAQAEADQANEAMKQSYQAAAQAAQAHARAAKASAAAQRSAAAATKEVALTQHSVARIMKLEAEGYDKAKQARDHANNASQDAQAAGIAAQNAQESANAAAKAAQEADTQATAAQNAAADAQRAADQAQVSADNAAESAKSAAQAAAVAAENAKAAEKSFVEAEQALREKQRQQRIQALNATDGMQAGDKDALNGEFSAEEVQRQLEQAEKDANFDWKEFIIREGGELLFELIGVNDALKCFTEGNIEACIWTIINFAPGPGKILKCLELSPKIARIAAKVPRLMEKINNARSNVDHLKDLANKVRHEPGCAKKGTCKLPGACFAAGTKIALGTGLFKPIEEIKIGDRVQSFDETTGTFSPNKVLKTFIHHNVDTYWVTLGDQSKIETTAEHPFYVSGIGWVPAIELQLGDRLLKPDGSTLVVHTVQPTGHQKTVYNFEVEKAHTYLVKTDTSSVIVHNSCDEAAAKMIEEYGEKALANSTGSGTTVLGKFGKPEGYEKYRNYIEKAKDRGDSYFNLGDEWTEIMAVHGDPWPLNEYFLKQRIEAGDKFVMNLPKEFFDNEAMKWIQKGGEIPYSKRELDYLKANGYQWVNQWCLKKK